MSNSGKSGNAVPNSGSSSDEDSRQGSPVREFVAANSSKGKAVEGSSGEPNSNVSNMSRAVRETLKLNVSNTDKGKGNEGSSSGSRPNYRSESNRNRSHQYIPGSLDARAIGNSLPRTSLNPFRLRATPVLSSGNSNFQGPSVMPGNSYPRNQVRDFGTPNWMTDHNIHLFLPYWCSMQISPLYGFNPPHMSRSIAVNSPVNNRSTLFRPQILSNTRQFMPMANMVVPVFSESHIPYHAIFWGYTPIYQTGPTTAFVLIYDPSGFSYSLPLEFHPLMYYPGFAHGNMMFSPSPSGIYLPWGSGLIAQQHRQLLNQATHGMNSQQNNMNPEVNNDEFQDMRLDIQDWSHEELVALEERIGNVNIGLSESQMSCMRTQRYRSDLQVEPCGICKEAFIVGDELGILDCEQAEQHPFHTACIKTWLAIKNKCPICNAIGLSGQGPSDRSEGEL